MSEQDTTSKTPLLSIEMTEEEFYEHRESHNGVCLGCGETAEGGTEPDAREYPCGSCNERKVYGMEEALAMGKILFAEG